MRINLVYGLTVVLAAAVFAQPVKIQPKQKQPALTAVNPQQMTAPAPAEAGLKTEAQLDEVLVQANSRVTGSKTDVPIHDTPASIVVVPKEIIEDQQSVDMNQMAKNVSGLTPTLAGGYGFSDSFMMRGLNMRFLRDGLPDGNTWNGYMRTNTDVESIEVLKGPGSAIYGRAEPGGVVNITTKKPMDSFGASLETMGGFWNTYRGVLDVGGPLGTPALPARLNASYYHTDGYRGLNRTIGEFLPSFAWKINDKHTITVDYDYRNIKARPDNYGILFGADRSLLSVSKSNTYYSPFNTATQQVHRAVIAHEGVFSSKFKLRSALIYDNRDLYLLRNAGGSVNAAGTQMTGRTAREQGDKSADIVYQTEAVLKFLTGDMAHTLLTGIEAQSYRVNTWRTDYNLPAITNLVNPVVLERSIYDYAAIPSFDRQITNQTVSAYAQEQVAVTDYLKLRAGIRLDHAEIKDDGWQGATKTQRTIEMARDLISYQIGAVLQPWKPVSFYGGYSEGRFMSIQTESTALSVEPEKSSQIELGKKLNLFKDKLQTNLAFFRTTRENYYVTDAAGVVSPVGKRLTDGIELDIMGNPLKGLWLTLSSAFYDASIKSTERVSGVNTEGKAPQYVPEYTGNFWITYELQSGILKGLGFGGGPTVKSGLYVDALNLLRVPGYIVADAVLFYKRQNWQLQANFRNLTNEVYFATPTFSGALPGEPFNFTISAKARL